MLRSSILSWLSDIIAAVRAIIGISLILGLSDFLIILVASIPSSIGIWRSIRIISKSSFSIISRATWPSSACDTIIPQPNRNLLATKKLILLSSATSIFLPSSFLNDSVVTTWFPGVSSSDISTEMSKMKTDPLLGSLSTLIFPPSISISFLQIANPRPVPPKRLVVSADACVKLSKISVCFSFGIPIPVSTTLNSNFDWLPILPVSATRIFIPPLRVNFRALDKRFDKIWLSLIGSPTTESGRLFSLIISNSSIFSFALNENDLFISSRKSVRLNWVCSNTILPDSIIAIPAES